MIIDKTLKTRIKIIENTMRMQAEEKPHLLASGKSYQFFKEVRGRLPYTKISSTKNLDIEYIKDWLAGYRCKKKP